MVLGCSLLIFLGITVLAYLSRKEPGNLFDRMSTYLYDCLCSVSLPLLDSRRVESDLERLHPESSVRELVRSYYIGKLRMMLLILLAGALLCLLWQGKLHMEETFDEEGVIAREEVGGGEQRIQLEAEVAGEKEKMDITVAEKQLQGEELQKLFEECGKKLEKQILGTNTDLLQVSQKLELPEALVGYPFEIGWKSSDYTVIKRNGEVVYDKEKTSEPIELTAVLYYGEISYEYVITVTVVPDAEKKEDAGWQDKLQQEVIRTEVSSRYEDTLVLPTQLEGQEIKWKKMKEDNSAVFLLLTIAAAVGVYFLKDKDLHDELLEKKKVMKMYYPVIVNKFMLYMGAGMTVRGSFIKIAMDYQKKRNTEGENPAYEEMLYSCNELTAGVSEGLVYERFGRRSGLQEYARFTAMLSQNLLKGNASLLKRLREESDKALTEDLHYRKKLGEEAETKLLVPMIMMMAMVLLLVMIPAFSSFE